MFVGYCCIDISLHPKSSDRIPTQVLGFIGINRAFPVWERSRTEEDILRAALRPGGKHVNSGPTSASEDSNALEWENDFVAPHLEDSVTTEFEGFVNPVLDTPSEETSDRSLWLDKQDR